MAIAVRIAHAKNMQVRMYGETHPSLIRLRTVFAVHFELQSHVCPESAGVLVAFCQHWLAPYTDHVAKRRRVQMERTEAQCYLLGDVNIADDGKTVRFQMNHLIRPGAPEDCLNHTLGVIGQINGVLPVQRAWVACA